MKCAVIFALMLLATPALAQKPSNDAFDAALKEAKADPAIKTVLADRTRGPDARFRDQNRFVELILSSMALKPGRRVLDVGSGGGYLAVLAAKIVGDAGHVDIHNTPNWINQFPGMDPDAQRKRITSPNIGWVTSNWHGLPVEPDSYDVVVLGQIYHDVILEGGDVEMMNRKLFAMLKPGGRVVIEDHDAEATMPIGQQAGLHRVSHDAVTEQLTKAGFVLKAMHLHDNPQDNRRQNVFAPTLRGRTDRFIAVYVKPAG